jgi:Protein of unknown function (DUF2794)
MFGQINPGPVFTISSLSPRAVHIFYVIPPNKPSHLRKKISAATIVLIMNSFASVISFNPAALGRTRRPHFSREELAAILNIYGQMVAAGQWKDYAIEQGHDKIVFSVFRRAAEVPAYRIIKQPLSASTQGVFSIVGRGGEILRRGHSLETTLRHFRRKLLKLVD